MRVTRPAVEYLSMFENEKFWMFRYIAERRLAAKPVEAVAEKRPAMMPKNRLSKAIPTISTP